MENNWVGLLDFCLIGACLLVATFLRSRIRFLQTYLVPNNIVAGFLCFLLGGEALGLVSISADRFGGYVYHLLAVTFIAMALRGAPGGRKVSALSTGFILAVGIGVQVVVGLVISYLWYKTLMPDLFVAFGYYLMLGFSQGPGQAYALGKSWEPLGFAGAGNLGLTFAAIGYLWACIVGVILVNRGLARRKERLGDKIERIPKGVRTGLIADPDKREEAGRLTTASSAVESLAFHLSLVGIVYLATYGLLKGAEALILAGGDGEMTRHLASTLWGIHFVFASLLALAFRKLLAVTRIDTYVDDGLLTRITGTALDFMVTAAIAAISLSVLRRTLGLTLTLTTVGGIATIWFVYHAVRRSGLSHPLERFASIFGTMTGTLSTGLTLNRMVDPKFTSPAPHALIFGAAFTLPMSLPYILSSFLPIYGRNQPNPDLYYLGVIGLSIVYTLALYLIWRLFVVRRV